MVDVAAMNQFNQVSPFAISPMVPSFTKSDGKKKPAAAANYKIIIQIISISRASWQSSRCKYRVNRSGEKK